MALLLVLLTLVYTFIPQGILAKTCPGFPGYCSESFPGQTCVVVCSRGRNNVPLCQEDGTWTDIPRCVEHEPGVKQQIPGICPGISGYCSEGFVGHRCSFDCTVGPNIRSTCTLDGTWKPYPKCQGDIRETQDGCDPCPGPLGSSRNRTLESRTITPAPPIQNSQDRSVIRPTFSGNQRFGVLDSNIRFQTQFDSNTRQFPTQFNPQQQQSQPLTRHRQPQKASVRLQLQQQQQQRILQLRQQQQLLIQQRQRQEPHQPTLPQQPQQQQQPRQPVQFAQTPRIPLQSQRRTESPTPQPPKRSTQPQQSTPDKRPNTRFRFVNGELVPVEDQPSTSAPRRRPTTPRRTPAPRRIPAPVDPQPVRDVPISTFESFDGRRTQESENRFVVGSDGSITVTRRPPIGINTVNRPRHQNTGPFFGPFEVFNPNREPAVPNLPVLEAVPNRRAPPPPPPPQQQDANFGPFQLINFN